jgi:hypothetical protein
VRSSKLAALGLAVLAALAPAPVAAINPDAQAFFAQGRKLRRDGDCDRAIVAFRHALESAPEGLGALRNIAECEEELGRHASARIDWRALHRAVLQSDDSRYAGWEKDAEAGYGRLEGKVGKLVVRLHGDDLGRVKVTIDGQPLAPGLIGVELERDPGPHTIEASKGSAAPIVEKRTLAVGGREEVTLLIPSSRRGEPRGEATPVPQGAASGGHAMRNAGLVLLSAGGLGAIGALAAIAMRQSALSSIEQACPGYAMGQVCPASVGSDRDTGRAASALATVFGGIAVVGIGVGIPLAVVGSQGSSAPVAKALPVALGVLPAGGGATAWARVRF